MYLSNDGSVTLLTPLGWGKDFWQSICSGAMTMQLALFIFNMLPAYPLDGGHLLKTLLAYHSLPPSTVARVTALVGSVFGWYFILGGLRGGGEEHVGHSLSSLLQLMSGGNELCIGAYILCECFALWREGTAALHEEDNGGATTPAYATPTQAPSVPVAAESRTAARGAAVIHTLASPPSSTMPGAGRPAGMNNTGGGGGMSGAGRRLGSAEDNDYALAAV
jgi:hypothetical protein